MDEKPLETCIESICERGCREVRRVIERLERDGDVAETASLSAAERAFVLNELKAIMSVYDARPAPEE